MRGYLEIISHTLGCLNCPSRSTSVNASENALISAVAAGEVHDSAAAECREFKYSSKSDVGAGSVEDTFTTSCESSSAFAPPSACARLCMRKKGLEECSLHEFALHCLKIFLIAHQPIKNKNIFRKLICRFFAGLVIHNYFYIKHSRFKAQSMLCAYANCKDYHTASILRIQKFSRLYKTVAQLILN